MDREILEIRTRKARNRFIWALVSFVLLLPVLAWRVYKVYVSVERTGQSYEESGHIKVHTRGVFLDLGEPGRTFLEEVDRANSLAQIYGPALPESMKTRLREAYRKVREAAGVSADLDADDRALIDRVGIELEAFLALPSR